MYEGDAWMDNKVIYVDFTKYKHNKKKKKFMHFFRNILNNVLSIFSKTSSKKGLVRPMRKRKTQ